MGCLAIASLLGIGITNSAHAAAIVSNGTIQLGVDNFGQLNVYGETPSLSGTTFVGLRYLPTGAEATAPGCLCEGWGVADAASLVTGYANNDWLTSGGTSGINLLSFTSTATEATSVVDIGGIFKVTHHYTPSTATANLYEAKVTIENISGSTVADTRYRRVMDWDIEPTPFSEYVTIAGTTIPSALLFASNNGFASANPLSGPSDLGYTGDFVDAGPSDHGALFDFGFGSLVAGESKEFSIFYGAAGNELDALAALATVDAKIYSLGQSDPATGGPNTFIFAFKGVEVPEPGTLAGLLAVSGFGLLSRKKRQSNTNS